MAVRTNRDRSALSRFERGERVPRDLDRLVEHYASLRPRPVIPGHLPIIGNTAKPHTLFVAFYIIRWIALGAGAMVAVAVASAGTVVQDTLRTWLLFSAATLMVIILRGYWRQDRGRLRRPPLAHVVLLSRSLIPTVLLATVVASHYGRPCIDMQVFIATAIWVELGYWVWEFNLHS